MITIRRNVDVEYSLTPKDIVDTFTQLYIEDQVSVINGIINYINKMMTPIQKDHWINYFCEQQNRDIDTVNFLKELALGIENVELW